MDRTDPAMTSSRGFDRQEIPPSATVESLLKNDFIPPFVAMGEDMVRNYNCTTSKDGNLRIF